MNVEILASKAKISQLAAIQETPILSPIRLKIRNIPYLPSFNKTPAKIIDPEVLASTWALGSQKWPPKIGILIKKGSISTPVKICPVFISDLVQNTKSGIFRMMSK